MAEEQRTELVANLTGDLSEGEGRGLMLYRTRGRRGLVRQLVWLYRERETVDKITDF